MQQSDYGIVGLLSGDQVFPHRPVACTNARLYCSVLGSDKFRACRHTLITVMHAAGLTRLLITQFTLLPHSDTNPQSVYMLA